MSNLLGIRKAKSYQGFVVNMSIVFDNIGYKMSIKLHYMFLHIDWLLENLGAMSDEKGSFNYNMQEMEIRCQGH